MGLLDQILGGALGGRGGGLGGGLGREPASQGGGMGRVLISLLPVVLSMLANRRSAGDSGGSGGGGGLGGMLGGREQAGTGGGGLGGLGSILGGAGLGGLLEQFRQRGLSSQADSWVSTGANQPLAPEDVDGVFGADGISQIAQEAGLSDIETREGLAQLLPDVVDRLTPDGNLPPDDDLNSALDDFLGRLRG